MAEQELASVRSAVEAARRYWTAFMDESQQATPRVEEIEELPTGYRIVLSIPAPGRFSTLFLTGEAEGKELKTFFVSGDDLAVKRMLSGRESLAS